MDVLFVFVGVGVGVGLDLVAVGVGVGLLVAVAFVFVGVGLLLAFVRVGEAVTVGVEDVVATGAGAARRAAGVDAPEPALPAAIVP